MGWTGVTFESFDQIVRSEGGVQNPANITAAEEACKGAMSKGKKFVKFDTKTKRVGTKTAKIGVHDKKEAHCTYKRTLMLCT